MHVIVRALLLPWIVTFAAAAGVVKLNTKADTFEAVVAALKNQGLLHPAATEAALAVAKNGVASVLKDLEASDTSTENVAFEDENERRPAAAEQSTTCPSMIAGGFSRKACLLWMSFLNPSIRYFEWGSGFTTRAADKIAMRVTSSYDSLLDKRQRLRRLNMRSSPRASRGHA